VTTKQSISATFWITTPLKWLANIGLSIVIEQCQRGCSLYHFVLGEIGLFCRYLTFCIYMLYIILISVVVTVAITTLILMLFYGRRNAFNIKNLIKYEALIEVLRIKIEELQFESEKAGLELRDAVQAKYEAMSDAEVAKTKLGEFDKRLFDFEQNKKASLENSKAAIFEIANQLSSKLVSDHRRESEEVRQKSFEKFNEATEKYQKQFEQVVDSVSALNSQVKDTREVADIVKRALLSPGGAGSLAEITLENILKSSGLIDGTDYKIQYSINQGENRQRPDAVVFLPSNNVFVIDSKASKFFLEAEFSGNEELNDKMLLSMKNHIKQLASREYQFNVVEHLKANGHKSVNHFSTIMFLPSEAMIDKLQKSDYEFLDKAWQQNIFPSGPSGLINLLSHAKFMISQNLQMSNQEFIIAEVRNLLSGLFVIAEHAKKLGSNLQSASLSFDKFAGSFNRNILSKTKKLSTYGITGKNGKQLPPEIERFQIINLKQDIIEIDPDETGDSESSKMIEKEELV